MSLTHSHGAVLEMLPHLKIYMEYWVWPGTWTDPELDKNKESANIFKCFQLHPLLTILSTPDNFLTFIISLDLCVMKWVEDWRVVDGVGEGRGNPKKVTEIRLEPTAWRVLTWEFSATNIINRTRHISPCFRLKLFNNLIKTIKCPPPTACLRLF